ncbi:MAG: hypothetical protein R2765_09960 [Ferruginibacter sp.]
MAIRIVSKAKQKLNSTWSLVTVLDTYKDTRQQVKLTGQNIL